MRLTFIIIGDAFNILNRYVPALRVPCFYHFLLNMDYPWPKFCRLYREFRLLDQSWKPNTRCIKDIVWYVVLEVTEYVENVYDRVSKNYIKHNQSILRVDMKNRPIIYVFIVI